MTIDQVREAAVRADPVRRLVDADPVRRLVEVAPSTDELRSAISDGLDALGEGLGSVAVQLGRPAPARRSPWPALAIVGIIAGLAIGFLLTRVDRGAWTTLRDRATRTAGRIAGRVPDARDVADGPRILEDEPARSLHAIEVDAGSELPSQDDPVEAAVASHG